MVKKLLFAGILLFVSFFLVSTKDVKGTEDRGAFIITNFDVGIFVKKDAKIEVKETIDVNFSQKRYGIFRKIPVRYTDDNGFKYNMKLKNVLVSDGKGNAFEFSKYDEGSDVVLKIGNPSKELLGDVRYQISYEVQRGMRFFDDHSELYWNPIGVSWPTVIENVSSTVHFEESLIFPKESVVCFTGNFGSKESACQINVLSDRAVEFRATRTLDKFEGLTVGVSIPKGMVTEPTKREYFLLFLADNWAFGIPVIVLLAMFHLWYFKGKELDLKRTIIAQYGPPDKLTPGEMGFLLKEHYSHNFVSADIVNLAVKGFIEIGEVEREGVRFEMLKVASKVAGKGVMVFKIAFMVSMAALMISFFFKEGFSFNLAVPGLIFLGAIFVIFFFNGEKLKQSISSAELADYELENKKDWRVVDDLTAHEKVLMTGLFGGNVLGKVKLSSKKKFYEDVKSASKEVVAQIDSKGYFEKSKYNIKALYVAAGIIFGFGMFFLGSFYQRADFFISAILVAGILIGFGVLMSKKTKKGAEAYWHAIGYQRYIDVAEQHRAEFNEKENIFEKTLPYAMVFGSVDKWAKAFEGITKETPTWYHSSTPGTSFHPAIFAHSLNQNFSTVTSSVSASPSSSSSGGSSGGGGGGGGGGSW